MTSRPGFLTGDQIARGCRAGGGKLPDWLDAILMPQIRSQTCLWRMNLCALVKSLCCIWQLKSYFVVTVLHKYPLWTDRKSTPTTSRPLNVLSWGAKEGKTFPKSSVTLLPVSAFFLSVSCATISDFLCALHMSFAASHLQTPWP